MRGARYRETALMFRLIAALLCLLASLPAAADLAIINARIYPSPEAEPIERGSVVMREGRIVALKGIGGYQLVCDAANADAVADCAFAVEDVVEVVKTWEYKDLTRSVLLADAHLSRLKFFGQNERFVGMGLQDRRCGKSGSRGTG